MITGSKNCLTVILDILACGLWMLLGMGARFLMLFSVDRRQERVIISGAGSSGISCPVWSCFWELHQIWIINLPSTPKHPHTALDLNWHSSAVLQLLYSGLSDLRPLHFKTSIYQWQHSYIFNKMSSCFKTNFISSSRIGGLKMQGPLYMYWISGWRLNRLTMPTVTGKYHTCPVHIYPCIWFTDMNIWAWTNYIWTLFMQKKINIDFQGLQRIKIATLFIKFKKNTNVCKRIRSAGQSLLILYLRAWKLYLS